PQPDPNEQRRDPKWVPVQGELFPEIRPEEADGRSDAGREIRAPQHWERLLIDASVVGGRDRWKRRLDGLDHEVQKQSEDVQGEDEPRLARVERQRERLQDLRNFALPIIDFLDALPKTALWGTWLDCLQQLATMSIQRPDAVLSVIAELRPMATV